MFPKVWKLWLHCQTKEFLPWVSRDTFPENYFANSSLQGKAHSKVPCPEFSTTLQITEGASGTSFGPIKHLYKFAETIHPYRVGRIEISGGISHKHIFETLNSTFGGLFTTLKWHSDLLRIPPTRRASISGLCGGSVSPCQFHITNSMAVATGGRSVSTWSHYQVESPWLLGLQDLSNPSSVHTTIQHCCWDRIHNLSYRRLLIKYTSSPKFQIKVNHLVFFFFFFKQIVVQNDGKYQRCEVTIAHSWLWPQWLPTYEVFPNIHPDITLFEP